MEKRDLDNKFNDLIEALQEEYEYWYNCWNATECNSGNCRLISLTISKVKVAENILKELKR